MDAAVLVSLDDLVLRRAHDEEPRGQGVLLHEAEQHHLPAAGQGLPEVGLVEEDRLQPAAPVVEPHLVDRQAAGAAQARHHDLARDRDAHAGDEVGDPREAAPVLVAHREVQEEVLGGDDADSPEGFRLLGADALDELDRRLEVHVPREIFPRPAAGRGPTGRNRRGRDPARGEPGGR